MSRSIIWRVPALFSVLNVGFCPDEQAWRENRAKVLRTAAVDLDQYPHPRASGMFTCWRDHLGKPYGLVTIADKHDSDPVGAIGVIAHECSHVVDKIFEVACEAEPGGETRAYLTEWCVRTILLDYVKSIRSPRTLV